MGAGIQLTTPLELSAATLVATDVPEADYAAYDAGVTYALGARCISAHLVWESAANGNIGHDPATAGEAWWLRVAPTNRWGAFDTSHTTTTAKAGGFYFEFQPGRSVSAVHLLSLTDCDTLRVRLVDGASTVYDSGAVSVGRKLAAASWYAWCYGRRALIDQMSFYGMPATYPMAVLRIDVTGGDNCAVGVIMAGTLTELGIGVQTGVRLRIDDTSKKMRDRWNQVVLAQGEYFKRMSFVLVIDADEVDAIYNYLVDRRATAFYWNVLDRWKATQVYGFFESFEVLLSNAKRAIVSIELSGMTLR